RNGYIEAGKPRLTQRSHESKSDTQSYSMPGTQPERPASCSALPCGVKAGSCPSAGLTNIEVRQADGEVFTQSARPWVPEVPMPRSDAGARLPADLSAAAARRACSCAVCQKRSPYAVGLWSRMRVLLRYSIW